MPQGKEFLLSWSQDARLVKLVSKIPLLYDPKAESYKDNTARDYAWDEIGAKLGLSRDVCKKRWRNIRDAYKRILRDKRNDAEFGTVSKRPKWFLYDHLHFLESSTATDETAPQNEHTPVASTSGVVPKPSTSTAVPIASSHQPVKSTDIPVQADVSTSAKPFISMEPESEARSIPTPPAGKGTTAPIPEPDPLPPLEDDNSVSVKWNTYATNMSSVMPNLLEDEKFVDVTLACDGKYIKCHKVILGACSPYFEELLSVNPCQHPIILMKDFHFWEIRAIVDFMYCGVVNIPQNQLPALMKVATALQIKGLTGSKDYTGPKTCDQKNDSCTNESQSKGGSKLKKRSKSYPESDSKTSKVPVKKLKIMSKSSSRNSIEFHSSDECSNQSVSVNVPQLPDPALAVSLEPEPSTLLHSVCIKEETPDYDVDDSSTCSMAKDDLSQHGQSQLLALSGSRTIKEEVIEEIFEATDTDPLDLESGVS